jgi:hypothetical protein
MGLTVSAQVIRDLVVDGDYLVECIEQRERGKVAVAFALRSRAQPYSIQIETMDNKLGALFRALFEAKPSQSEQPALMRVGSQPVQVVEVESVPADAAKGRRHRNRKSTPPAAPNEPLRAASRGRRATRQLVLMPSETSHELTATPTPSKRRRAVPARHDQETL